jgi:hypothetical protein
MVDGKGFHLDDFVSHECLVNDRIEQKVLLCVSKREGCYQEPSIGLLRTMQIGANREANANITSKMSAKM